MNRSSLLSCGWSTVSYVNPSSSWTWSGGHEGAGEKRIRRGSFSVWASGALRHGRRVHSQRVSYMTDTAPGPCRRKNFNLQLQSCKVHVLKWYSHSELNCDWVIWWLQWQSFSQSYIIPLLYLQLFTTEIVLPLLRFLCAELEVVFTVNKFILKKMQLLYILL